MVVFDTSILLLLLHPDAKRPIDPATKMAVEKAAERITHLVDVLIVRLANCAMERAGFAKAAMRQSLARQPNAIAERRHIHARRVTKTFPAIPLTFRLNGFSRAR
jgi:hypothetical protein